MKIGEAARRAGVTTSRIRFYEAEGLIAPASRSPNGYRDYPESLVEVLLFIEQGQRLGFSLREIGARSPVDVHDCRGLLQPLQAKLAEVDAHIAAAQARRAEIVELIGQVAARERERDAA